MRTWIILFGLLLVTTAVLLPVFFAVIVPPKKNVNLNPSPMIESAPITTTSNSGTASVSAAKGKPSPPSTTTPSPVVMMPSPITPPPPTVVDCEVLTIGAGPGGLTLAYRLAPKLGSRLCVVDERNHYGGKVESVLDPRSTNAHPVWTPTCAEQHRIDDVIGRCVAQELGATSVSLGSVASSLEFILRDVNGTGFACTGNNTQLNTSATCIMTGGYPVDVAFAPNSDLQRKINGVPVFNLPEGLCGDKNVFECSYMDEIMARIIAPKYANSIKPWETFQQYVTRILNADAYEYLIADIGNYFEGSSANAMVEFLRYDAGLFYGRMNVLVGGPQIAIWNPMAKRILGNGSRIDLNTHIDQVSHSTDGEYRYVATSTAANVRYRANRVVFAFPALHMQSMSGDIVESIKSSTMYKYTSSNPDTTWNGMYETSWWFADHVRDQCTYGWCSLLSNITTRERLREHAVWNFWSSGSADKSKDFSFIQFLPTPEREQGHLLRIFFDAHDSDSLNALLETGGQEAVTIEITRRLNLVFAEAMNMTIPLPAFAHYQYERTALGTILAGAPFTLEQHEKWAAKPLTGEFVSLVSENYRVKDMGWMEAAMVSAHSALRTDVFSDLLSNSEVSNFERCHPTVWSNLSNSNRYLDTGNTPSTQDLCLLLTGEYHLRDLSGLKYCGGPDTYVQPTYTELTGEELPVVNQDLWATTTSEPVTDSHKGRHRRYSIA